MKREIIPASKEHEENFRKNYQLKSECKDNPEHEAAFEYAATTKLDIDEMNFIGAIIEAKGEKP